MANPVENLNLILDTAKKAVEAACLAAMKHFGQSPAVETKADSSPVTRADKEAEEAILKIIFDQFPDHSVLAEESGAMGNHPSTRWIVDPIDGTRGFIREGAYWGPLVAVEHQGVIVAGAMALPVLGETYFAAKDIGCYKNGSKLQVSTVENLSEASLSLGELPALLAPPHGPKVQSLIDGAWSARSFGDLAGCAMVLKGKADAWLEAGIQPWDIAPHKILIEEAGGIFTSFEGRPTIEAGNALGSNGLLHPDLLRRLGKP